MAFYSAFEAEFYDFFPGQLPCVFTGFPGAAYGLDFVAQGGFSGCDVEEKLFLSGRCTRAGDPFFFIDDQFDGFKSFFPDLVVAVTDADELVAVFCLQLFGAVLAGVEGCFDIHIPPGPGASHMIKAKQPGYWVVGSWAEWRAFYVISPPSIDCAF